MLRRIKEALQLNEAQWIGFRLGILAGLVLFVVYGAPNALVYGGYGGLILVGKIVGTPVEPAILARVVIAVGMLLGLLSSALLFIVLTSLFGIGVGSIGNLIATRVKAIRAAEEAARLAASSVSAPMVTVAREKVGAAVMVRRWTKAGAVVGVTLFFVYGLIPGAVYGGATGIILANRVFSMSEPPLYMKNTLYVLGSVVGALGTAALFIVLGAVAGTLFGYAYNAGREKLSSPKEAAGDYLGEARAKSK